MRSRQLTGEVGLPSKGGYLVIKEGTGDNATWSIYNTLVRGWWGLAFAGYEGIPSILFDLRSGNISTNGTVVGQGFVTTSSREIKQDIRPLDVDADIIDRFQPVTFRFKAAPEREVAGMILEDVTEIFPLACTNGGIDYSQLVPLLIATIQRDRARLRDLAARVEALEQTLGQTLHDLPAQPTGDSEA